MELKHDRQFDATHEGLDDIAHGSPVDGEHEQCVSVQRMAPGHAETQRSRGCRQREMVTPYILHVSAEGPCTARIDIAGQLQIQVVADSEIVTETVDI